MPSVRVQQRSRPSTSLLVALAFVGCATSSSSSGHLKTTSGPEQRFLMVGNGFQTSALLTMDGAQGPDINIGRFDNGATIRGTLYQRPFQLSIDQAAGSATGQGGMGPISINATEEGDNLKCTGLILGRPSTLNISSQRIEGTVGFCAYDLGSTGENYVGSRSCGRGISNATVTFPTTINQWKAINVCILIALLMSTP